jgi:hypothetical protein
LLGRAKLDTTALYTRVATKTIREVMSLLELRRQAQEGCAAGLKHSSRGPSSRISSAATPQLAPMQSSYALSLLAVQAPVPHLPRQVIGAVSAVAFFQRPSPQAL